MTQEYVDVSISLSAPCPLLPISFSTERSVSSSESNRVNAGKDVYEDRLKSQWSDGGKGSKMDRSQWSDGGKSSKMDRSQWSDGGKGSKMDRSQWSDGGKGIEIDRSQWSDGGKGSTIDRSQWSDGGKGSTIDRSQWSDGGKGSKIDRSQWSDGGKIFEIDTVTRNEEMSAEKNQKGVLMYDKYAAEVRKSSHPSQRFTNLRRLAGNVVSDLPTSCAWSANEDLALRHKNASLPDIMATLRNDKQLSSHRTKSDEHRRCGDNFEDLLGKYWNLEAQQNFKSLPLQPTIASNVHGSDLQRTEERHLNRPLYSYAVPEDREKYELYAEKLYHRPDRQLSAESQIPSDNSKFYRVKEGRLRRGDLCNDDEMQESEPEEKPARRRRRRNPIKSSEELEKQESLPVNRPVRREFNIAESRVQQLQTVLRGEQSKPLLQSLSSSPRTANGRYEQRIRLLRETNHVPKLKRTNTTLPESAESPASFSVANGQSCSLSHDSAKLLERSEFESKSSPNLYQATVSPQSQNQNSQIFPQRRSVLLSKSESKFDRTSERKFDSNSERKFDRKSESKSHVSREYSTSKSDPDINGNVYKSAGAHPSVDNSRCSIIFNPRDGSLRSISSADNIESSCDHDGDRLTRTCSLIVPSSPQSSSVSVNFWQRTTSMPSLSTLKEDNMLTMSPFSDNLNKKARNPHFVVSDVKMETSPPETIEDSNVASDNRFARNDYKETNDSCSTRKIQKDTSIGQYFPTTSTNHRRANSVSCLYEFDKCSQSAWKREFQLLIPHRSRGVLPALQATVDTRCYSSPNLWKSQQDGWHSMHQDSNSYRMKSDSTEGPKQKQCIKKINYQHYKSSRMKNLEMTSQEIPGARKTALYPTINPTINLQLTDTSSATGRSQTGELFNVSEPHHPQISQPNVLPPAISKDPLFTDDHTQVRKTKVPRQTQSSDTKSFTERVHKVSRFVDHISTESNSAPSKIGDLNRGDLSNSSASESFVHQQSILVEHGINCVRLAASYGKRKVTVADRTRHTRQAFADDNESEKKTIANRTSSRQDFADYNESEKKTITNRTSSRQDFTDDNESEKKTITNRTSSSQAVADDNESEKKTITNRTSSSQAVADDNESEEKTIANRTSSRQAFADDNESEKKTIANRTSSRQDLVENGRSESTNQFNKFHIFESAADKAKIEGVKSTSNKNFKFPIADNQQEKQQIISSKTSSSSITSESSKQSSSNESEKIKFLSNGTKGKSSTPMADEILGQALEKKKNKCSTVTKEYYPSETKKLQQMWTDLSTIQDEWSGYSSSSNSSVIHSTVASDDSESVLRVEKQIFHFQNDSIKSSTPSSAILNETNRLKEFLDSKKELCGNRTAAKSFSDHFLFQEGKGKDRFREILSEDEAKLRCKCADDIGNTQLLKSKENTNNSVENSAGFDVSVTKATNECKNFSKIETKYKPVYRRDMTPEALALRPRTVEPQIYNSNESLKAISFTHPALSPYSGMNSSCEGKSLAWGVLNQISFDSDQPGQQLISRPYSHDPSCFPFRNRTIIPRCKSNSSFAISSKNSDLLYVDVDRLSKINGLSVYAAESAEKRFPQTPISTAVAESLPLIPISTTVAESLPLISTSTAAAGKRCPLTSISTAAAEKRFPLSPISTGAVENLPLVPISAGTGDNLPLIPISAGTADNLPLTPISASVSDLLLNRSETSCSRTFPRKINQTNAEEFASSATREVGTMKIGDMEVDAGEVGVIGIGDDAEAGVGEVGDGEVGVAEDGFGKVDVGKVGFKEVGVGKVGIEDVGVGEVGVGNVGVGKVDVEKVDVGKVGVGKVGVRKVDVGGSRQSCCRVLSDYDKSVCNLLDSSSQTNGSLDELSSVSLESLLLSERDVKNVSVSSWSLHDFALLPSDLAPHSASSSQEINPLPVGPVPMVHKERNTTVACNEGTVPVAHNEKTAPVAHNEKTAPVAHERTAPVTHNERTVPVAHERTAPVTHNERTVPGAHSDRTVPEAHNGSAFFCEEKQTQNCAHAHNGTHSRSSKNPQEITRNCINYIDFHQAEGKQTDSPNSEQRTSASSPSESSISDPSDHQLNPLIYEAVFPYTPCCADELELAEDDLVTVLAKCDDGWFVGVSQRTRRFGTFPGNYVAPVHML